MNSGVLAQVNQEKPSYTGLTYDTLVHTIKTFLYGKVKPTTMTLNILPSADNQYYFTLNARNGRVLMTSETYKSKRNVLRAATKILSTCMMLSLKMHIK